MGVPLGTAASVHFAYWSVLGRCLSLCPLPLMVDTADGESPNPGFELLCTVEADLRKPFHAASVKGSGRKRFKEVQVYHEINQPR
jgi:hypothetical protein